MSEMRGTSLEDLKSVLANENFSVAADSGVFPLHEVGKVDRDLVDFAIERGAQVNVRSEHGHTPLDIAVAHGNAAVVRSLLRHGADLETRDRYGNTPLLSAVLAGSKAYGIVNLLLDAGADPDAENKNNLSARIVAIEDNHPSKPRMQA